MNHQRTADFLSWIDREHPVRNRIAQKKSFQTWALEAARQNGFVQAKVNTVERHENLTFGNLDTARVVFTAHYDTPRRSLLPNLMLVTNRVLFWAYHLGIVLVILASSLGAAFAVKNAMNLDWNDFPSRLLVLAMYLGIYCALIYLLLRGPANRHNRNDNTSGTAAVMELMRRNGEKDGVAYILFDDEEKGKKGSKAFVKANPAVNANALIINLDCVGNGNTFVFCPSDKAENSPLYAQLKKTVRQTDLNACFFPAGKAQMNSDHKSFDQGVGVCACSYKPMIGYYTGRIHTCRDIVAEPENIERLADALSRFLET